ncbi:MAG: PorT family protein [Treponema sp.]|nr:PorT family protein [Treponema sp.]
MLNTSTGYRAFTSYEDMGGFLIGIPVLVSFNDWFALGSGLRYIQKNYSFQRDFGDWYIMYNNHTNGFLQVPVFADFSVGQNAWRMFFNMGATFGFWLHNNREGWWTGFSENPFDPFYAQMEQFSDSGFVRERDRRFEAALFAGVGFRYDINFLTPYISVQYNHGLTDLQRDYMINRIARYNNTITVQMGVLFRVEELLRRA